MSKPWDKLRLPVKQSSIKAGFWFTTIDYANITLIRLVDGGAILHISDQQFGPDGLRQLAKFCNELANQLEGK